MSSLEKRVKGFSDEEIAHSIQRRNRKKRTALAIATLTSATIFVGLEGYYAGEPLDWSLSWVDGGIPPSHTSVALRSLIGGLFANVAYTIYGDFLKSKTGLSTLIKGLKAIPQIFFGEDTEKRTARSIALTEGLLHIKEDPLERCALEAGLDLMQGRREEALRKYASVAGAYESATYRPSLVEWLEKVGKEIFMRCTPLRKRITVSNRIEAACDRIHKGFPKSAERHMREACAVKGSEQAQVNCLHGYFLESKRRTIPQRRKERAAAEARSQWRTTIEIILADPEVAFRKIPGTKTEVVVMKGGLGRDLFVFKRNNNRTTIDEEHAATRWYHDLYETYGEGENTVDPLHCLTVNQQMYLALRQIAGETLAECATGERVRSTIEALHTFHTRMNLHKGEAQERGVVLQAPDYHKLLREKYVGRVQARNPERLEERTRFLTAVLQQREQILCHRDCHPRNVLMGVHSSTGEEKAILIDLASMGLATRYMDLADLLESHRIKGEVGDRDKAIFLYNSLDRHRLGQEECLLECAQDATFKDLWTLGSLEIMNYGMDAPSLIEAKEYYKQRVSANLRRIGDLDRVKKDAARWLEDDVLAT